MGARPNETALLYVGRMAKEKNIILLLDAVADVMKRRRDVRLWMVGDGPDRMAAQRHARTIGIGDQVKCVGAIPRDQVDRFYAGSDLFVFASTTETQGLVIGEAMSHGLPAIAVRGGGASDNLRNGETGLIVGSSVAQISDAVESLLENPDILESFRANCLTYSQSWSHEASCEEVLSVYESVLARESDKRSVNEYVHSQTV